MKIADLLKEDENIRAGDIVMLELDDVLIESNVVETREDGIVLEFDEVAMMILDKYHTLMEQTLGTYKGGVWTATPPKKGEVGVPVPQNIDGGSAPPSKKPPQKAAATPKPAQAPSKAAPAGKAPLGTYKGGVWTADPPKKGEVGVPAPSALDEAEYQGRTVPLGKPMKGDVKKSKVYVKGPKGNVVKVNFGDKNMKIKKNIPARRKSFRARHNCANPGPRWKARYWSCKAW